MRAKAKILEKVGILVVLSALSGCGTIPSLSSDRSPRSVPEMPPREITLPVREVPSDGSLWRESGHKGLFRDLRAREVGDLVTVNISETSKAKKKADTKTSRDSSINAGINNMAGWETKIPRAVSLGSKNVRNAVDPTSLFKASLTNDFEGTGETTRDESMTASITARVTAVTPEGNLFITGTREIRVNQETQFITLTGLIRPEDISPDNTILSSYIADAKIAYAGSGSVSDKQRPGWLMRFVDYVWPF